MINCVQERSGCESVSSGSFTLLVKRQEFSLKMGVDLKMGQPSTRKLKKNRPSAL